MTTLAEIENAVSALTMEQKLALYNSLALQISPAMDETSQSHSVRDIPVLHVGRILRPFDDDDDVLGEMLEHRI